MSEWQPIETAPRDKSWFLATPGVYTVDMVRVWQVKDGRPYFEGWGGNSCRPTHWMPLPKPPESP